jgi:hypothetical protein
LHLPIPMLSDRVTSGKADAGQVTLQNLTWSPLSGENDDSRIHEENKSNDVGRGGWDIHGQLCLCSRTCG